MICLHLTDETTLHLSASHGRNITPAGNQCIFSSPDYQSEGFFHFQIGSLSRVPKFQMRNVFLSTNISKLYSPSGDQVMPSAVAHFLLRLPMVQLRVILELRESPVLKTLAAPLLHRL
jgi:hypothetical protein